MHFFLGSLKIVPAAFREPKKSCQSSFRPPPCCGHWSWYWSYGLPLGKSHVPKRPPWCRDGTGRREEGIFSPRSMLFLSFSCWRCWEVFRYKGPLWYLEFINQWLFFFPIVICFLSLADSNHHSVVLWAPFACQDIEGNKSSSTVRYHLPGWWFQITLFLHRCHGGSTRSTSGSTRDAKVCWGKSWVIFFSKKFP